MPKGPTVVEEIMGILQGCRERGFIERQEEDVLTSYMVEQELIRKLPTEGSSSLYEITAEGKKFFELVLELTRVAEGLVAN